MAQEEWQKNLPHLIALGVLLFALLIVATKAGFVRCSDLGTSYCDAYYTILGKPTIAIVEGDEGMGDPDALARFIQNDAKLPVQRIHIDQLSPGMLRPFSAVIVERARRIPTGKMQIFKDYVFADQGRLVWVGDSGTLGDRDDQVCKDADYDLYWDAGEGTTKKTDKAKVCVKESEISYPPNATASQINDLKRDALINKAFKLFSETLCQQAFGGKLNRVKADKGYNCENVSPGFSNVYIDWKNEATFRAFVNPWARGEYEALGVEDKAPGLNFGDDVLGVSFIADDFAVSAFDAYAQSLDDVQRQLRTGHVGLVACSSKLAATGCNPAAKLAVIRQDLTAVQESKNNALAEIGGIVATLESLKQQKTAKNDSAGALAIADAVNRIKESENGLKAISIDTDKVPSVVEINDFRQISTKLQDVADQLAVLRAGETDQTVVSQYNDMVSGVNSQRSGAATRVSKLESDIAAYNSCVAQGQGTLRDALVKAVGHGPEVDQYLPYVSPLIDDDTTVQLIGIVTGESGLKSEWADLKSKLESVDSQQVCGAADVDADAGFKAMAAALGEAEKARAKLEPGRQSEALATLLVAQTSHPLVQGIAQAIELKKGGLPVPFVLVTTTKAQTQTITQLKVTPAFKTKTLWPAITVKDPKFAFHVFGRGAVVFYAFPPETDETFERNLINFVIY